jgi:hypothetical protein
VVQTTEYGRQKTNSPSRGVRLNVTFIKVDATPTQQFQIFLTKGARFVMLGLLFDVMAKRFVLRSAHGKCAVTLLPCKSRHANLIVNPTRRNRLQLAKHVSQTMRCAEPDQQVYMMRDAADALWNALCRADDAAKVRMQVPAPRLLDYWLVIFRSENDVIVQAQMCR